MLLAIDSVFETSITLRRLHKDLNVGQPPAPAGGLTGVTFAINTLDPQTEEASFDIKRRFGIDENIVDRTSSWIYDLRDLRMATVLSVLLARYTQEARSDKGDFTRKLEQIKVELDQVLDRVQVRWGPYGNSEEPSTLFSCKTVTLVQMATAYHIYTNTGVGDPINYSSPAATVSALTWTSSALTFPGPGRSGCGLSTRSRALRNRISIAVYVSCLSARLPTSRTSLPPLLAYGPFRSPGDRYGSSGPTRSLIEPRYLQGFTSTWGQVVPPTTRRPPRPSC